LVGASAKPKHPSNEMLEVLLNSGYNMIPINPDFAGQQINGQTVYGKLSDMPMEVDIMVNIFQRSKDAGCWKNCG
jgi:predicted CoA-binding protein